MYAQLCTCAVQQIEAEEVAIWEEMLSATGKVEAEARQRYQQGREAKQVWCCPHTEASDPSCSMLGNLIHGRERNMQCLQGITQIEPGACTLQDHVQLK